MKRNGLKRKRRKLSGRMRRESLRRRNEVKEIYKNEKIVIL
jgi:hypothetical protein